MQRCHWTGNDPLMIQYHDKEWGVPVKNDRKLFEFLVLESAQAGLSWKTILHKRAGYKKLFANFDYQKIAKFRQKDIARLIKDSSIIRNRLKILATINNAQKFMEVQKEFGSFYNYSQNFTGGKIINGRRKTMQDIPAITPEAENFAKDLKKRGFEFLGATTIYAYMQAIGMVNDHLVSCCRYKEIKSLGKK